MERCSTSLVIREVPIKTTMRYHFIVSRMTKLNTADNNQLGGVGTLKPSDAARKTIEGGSHFEKQFGNSSKC